jgi:hypothetical protein
VVVLAEVNAFHVIGSAFAVWAVIVAALGLRRDDFPPSEGAQRAVIVISALLLAGTIGAAIATSEKHEAHGEHETKGSSHGDRANPTQEGEPAENQPNE